MSKVAVVYWSGTGNTEAMADLVAEGIKAAGGDAQMFQASDFDSSKVDDFDAFAFGCPAMGNEELEDMEFEPMYDDVEPARGTKRVMLFGSYDWAEGEWMETWSERAKSNGVNLVTTVIAKDYPDDEAAEACREAGGELV